MGLGSLSLRRQGSESSSGQSALQKALERNRKKQLKRNSMMSASSSTSSSSSSGVLNRLRGRSSDARTPDARSMNSTRSSVGTRSSLRSQLSASSTLNRTSTTRKTVARGNDVGFTTPLKKTTRKSPNVSYGTRTTKKRTTVKRKSVPLSDEGFLVKAGVYLGWAFCMLLFLRLVFAERGVIDYYKKSDLISQKLKQQNSLIAENKSLEIEIDKLDNNRAFQKKTVRKHLGVIANDEFLVLFAREVGKSTSKPYRH